MPKQKDDLLAEMRERFQQCSDWWGEVYQQCSDDLLFLYNEQNQWDEYTRLRRTWKGKPVLAQNELLVAHKAIVNRQQTNKIGIVVQAGNDEATERTGEFLQDATRSIEQESKAYVSYEWGFKQAVGGGIGWGRVLTEYESPKTFDQKVVVKRVLNPFAILPDCRSVEHDFSDSEYFFVNGRIAKDEHEKLLKNKQNTGGEITTFDFVNDKDFIIDDHVRVLEYWYKDCKEKTLIKVNIGGVTKEIYKEDYDKALYEKIKSYIVDERKVDVPTIKWIKTDGYNILQETEWLGDYFPFFAIIGDEVYVEGKRWFQGIVRNSKDAQKMLNHAVSSTAEIMSLATKAQWIGVKGSFTDNKWKDHNLVNYNHLEYTPVKLPDGTYAPPPQRIQFEPPVGRLNEQQVIASNFIKSTSGVYNASVGAPSDEKSGRAIQQRNAQTEITNYNYANNLESAVEYCGKIVVNLVMKMWDEPAKKRILKPDGTQKIVPINQEFEEQGEVQNIDLSKGEYTVTVTAGASYANKRQEQAALTLGMVQAFPIIAQDPAMAIPIAEVYSRDVGASEVAAIIKKKLEATNNISPQAQQQIQESQAIIEQLTQTANKLQDQIEDKDKEIASKERMNSENNQVKLALQEMNLHANQSTELFRAEIAEINSKLERLHALEMLDKQNEAKEQIQPAGENIPQEVEA